MPKFTADDALRELRAQREPKLVEARRQMALTNGLSAKSIPQSFGVDGEENPLGAPRRLYADYVMTSSGNTLTCAPSESKIIDVYVDSSVGWIEKTLEAAITLSTAGYTSGKNYDVFIYWDNTIDSFVLSTQVWTNDTTRAVALTTYDGARVLSTDETQRYLLTGRYNGSSLFVTSQDNNGSTLWGTGDKYDPTGADPVTGTIADQQGIRGYFAGALQVFISSVTGTIIGLAGGLIIDAAGFLLKAVGGASFISFTATAAKFGSDISAANTTAFAIFFTAQTYNTESMEAGSVLFGSNSANYANVLWRPSTKQLQFRSGTTVQAYVDTTGAITWGAVAVTGDANGANFVVPTAYNGRNSLKFLSGGVLEAELYTVDDGSTTAATIFSQNTGVSGTNRSYPSGLSITSQSKNGQSSTVMLQATVEGREVPRLTLVGQGASSIGAITLNASGGNVDSVIQGDTDANLLVADASTDRIGIGTATPAAKLDLSGSGILGASASDVLTINATPAGLVVAGTYTPTLTNTTNVAASTSAQCNYMRIGKQVNVSGRIAIDPTAAAATLLEISLPIASNIGGAADIGGCAACGDVAGMSAAVDGNAANDTAQLRYVATDLANRVWTFSFMYEVI
jgi:hypothetical protein